MLRLKKREIVRLPRGEPKNRLAAAVFVSGDGTNLKALIDARDSGKLPSCELTLVVSSKPEAYALKRAEQAGIHTAIVSAEDFYDQEAYDSRLLELCLAHGIEFVICAGFLRILGKTFVNAFRNRCINIHPSLLPAYGGKGMYGLRVHKAVLDAGETITGATVHYVNEIPDGGQIIIRREMEVCSNDTPESLQKRVMENAEWVILPLAAELCAKVILVSEGLL